MFNANEVTAIVGPSGSGKTSLLRLLAGLERPSGGKVVVAGVDLAGAGRERLRRHRRATASYVSQRPVDNFLPQLTLVQHAELAGATNATAKEVFAAVGLGNRLHARPPTLSGGEQARAAFGLALLRRTQLVLADEPTAELDDDSAATLLDAVTTTGANGAAVVIATHDAHVVAIADRALRLERGRIVDAPRAPRVEEPNGRPVDSRAQPPAAEAVGLTKRFHQVGGIVHAVEEVDFAAAPAAFTVVAGRSGSGKSTLLSLLGGWQRPDEGEVRYRIGHAGSDPCDLEWEALAYVPQRFGLVPELSIRENVGQPARLNRTLDRHAAWIDFLLDRLGLSELARRMPSEVSVGQQQRAAVARALALKPAVVLADEPTSHQDAGWRDAVVSLLKELSDDGMACVVATHEPEVARHGDALWWMQDGRLTPA
jgi:putative ABC transport system ATP-binding protein